MVIAHILSSFGQGGQERVAADLARLQRAHGHDVLAFSIAHGPEGPMAQVLREAGVPTTSTPKRARLDPSLPLRLASKLRQRRVDVVHTHNPHALIYGAPAAWLAGAIAVHSKHGMNPDRRRRLWLRRTAARLVDAYVAVTPMLAAKAVEQNDCHPVRLHVISNGIDVSKFTPNLERRRDVRRELGIPEDAWVVGTVGRLAPEKDQTLLIDGMAPLLSEKQRLVIVGDGPEKPGLTARVADTPGSPYVSFLGHRTDIERLLTAFDAFALTSRTEGLPLVLLEAMATGVPVVSTAVGGIPDLVKHDRTGLLVPAGDCAALTQALRALSADRTMSRLIGEAGRNEVLQRHSVDRMAREYDTLYRSLVCRDRRLVQCG
jgi:glycosyltransferase involved in cell wall biosynthesis